VSPESTESDRYAAHDLPESGSGPSRLTFTNVETLRPGSAIAAGVLGLGGGLALALPSLLSSRPSWPLISVVTLVLVLVWLYVVRPAVKLHDEGVRIVNPVSTVDITWPLITEVRSRWTLELVAGEKTFGAWGVPAATNRPRHGLSIFQLGAGKLLASEKEENRPPRARAEARTVAAEIESRVAADRQRTDGQTPRIVQRSWDPAPVGLLLSALAFVVIAFLV
jgi:hypothetical protein